MRLQVSCIWIPSRVVDGLKALEKATMKHGRARPTVSEEMGNRND